MRLRGTWKAHDEAGIVIIGIYILLCPFCPSCPFEIEQEDKKTKRTEKTLFSKGPGIVVL